jgi:hypothetical protein
MGYMRKNLQKRLLAVATVLDIAGQEKVALDDNKSLWNKFFSKKPAVDSKPAEKPTPNSTLQDLDQKADRGFAPDKDERGLFKKKAPPPGPRLPKALDEKLPNSAQDIQAFADFISGKGGVPLEVANPLKQLGNALAASGSISLKDASNVVSFLARVLRKYLAGQKLAKVEAHAVARKARLKTASDLDYSDVTVKGPGGTYAVIKPVATYQGYVAKIHQGRSKLGEAVFNLNSGKSTSPPYKDYNLKSLISLCEEAVRKIIKTKADFIKTKEDTTKTASVLKTAILSNKHKVSNDGGTYFVLESDKTPTVSDSWDTEVGHVSGLYRGNVKIDDANCVMFEGDNGTMYAVLRQNADIEEPAAVEASLDYSTQLKLFLSKQSRNRNNSGI